MKKPAWKIIKEQKKKILRIDNAIEALGDLIDTGVYQGKNDIKALVIVMDHLRDRRELCELEIWGAK